MRKPSKKSLSLSTTKIRVLSPENLQNINGGTGCYCIIIDPDATHKQGYCWLVAY